MLRRVPYGRKTSRLTRRQPNLRLRTVTSFWTFHGRSELVDGRHSVAEPLSIRKCYLVCSSTDTIDGRRPHASHVMDM